MLTQGLERRYNLTALLDEAVKDGKKGYNIGLPFSIKKLNKPTGGIQKGIYYLILGASKTGKSSFFYDQFIFNIADKIIKGELTVNDVEIIVYSLEINRVMIAAKAAVRYLLIKKKILTNIKQLLGVYGNTPDEIASVMNDDEFTNYLAIIDSITTIFTQAKVSEMYTYVKNRCLDESVNYGYDPMGNPLYHFKNRKKLMIVAVDHIALIPEIPKSSLKKTLDVASKEVFVKLKRQFGITPVVIQQVNPDDSGEGNKRIIYGHADARDTKNTFQDSDICIAIGSPFHEQVAAVKFRDGIYYIKKSPETDYKGLLDRFRLFGIEKDRYGDSAVKVASAFIGEAGIFTDIPEPNLVNYDKYELKEFRRING